MKRLISYFFKRAIIFGFALFSVALPFVQRILGDNEHKINSEDSFSGISIAYADVAGGGSDGGTDGGSDGGCCDGGSSSDC